MDRLAQFFSANFAAPHGYCLLWLPELVWLHVLSNALIAIAYFSIPLALWHFARKRPDMPFTRIFLLFASFITLCGLTHVFGILVLWWPAYGIEGLLMLLTGIVSSAVAVLVWRIMPTALRLPSPSELQRINMQLNASYEEVERKVSERTAELEAANTELEMARRKADAANQAKSEFLANMSHEIRTPMNVVIGLADILRKTELNEKQQEFVATLKTSADALMALINDLLDLERIEAQEVRLELKPFSVVTMLNDVERLMRMRAQEKGLQFRVVQECDFIDTRSFVGDAQRLRQVVLNLCSNAIKFTENGSVTVDVSCVLQADDNAIVNITVSDTGIGIAPDQQEAVFDKFVQADASISRKYGGTGLGLAIVKILIEKMQGTVTLESTPGEGSRFHVSLPMPTVAKAAPAKPKAPKPTRAASEKRVLLVEDYAPNVLVAQSVLEDFGYPHDVVTSGEDAVTACANTAYDVVLMDVQMPGMSGLEATQRIRAQEAGKTHVRIVGMTAHAMAGDRQICLDAGMDDYLAKPYTPDALKEKIEG